MRNLFVDVILVRNIAVCALAMSSAVVVEVYRRVNNGDLAFEEIASSTVQEQVVLRQNFA